MTKARFSGGFAVRGADLSELRGDNVRLEDYLDTLVAPLVGLVPYRIRFELRVETQGHLERQIDRLCAEGVSREAATEDALAAYGSARGIGDAFVAEWFQNEAENTRLKAYGRANYIAFGRFALAEALLSFSLMLRLFQPEGGAYALPMSPAEARHLLPSPFPITDLGPSTWAILALAVLSPLVAGFSSGLAIPVNPSRSIYQALMPIVIYAFVSGSLMLPLTEGLLLALFQALGWLPLGVLGGYLGSCVATHRRIRRGGVL